MKRTLLTILKAAAIIIGIAIVIAASVYLQALELKLKLWLIGR